MAVKHFLLLFFCFVLELSVAAPSIGSFFTRCSLKDPHLESCLLTQGNAIWPHLTEGVRKWGVLPLDPLRVDKIALSESGNQAVNVIIRGTNFIYSGYKDLEIQSVKADVDKLQFEFTVTIPELRGAGKYDLKGKLLFLPVQGSGDFNFTHEREHSVITFNFKRVEEGGKKLLKLEDVKYKILDVFKTSQYFGNLFGNKELSDNMNEILTKNARALFNDLKPRIEKTFAELWFSMLEPMFKTVDITELFVDVD